MGCGGSKEGGNNRPGDANDIYHMSVRDTANHVY